jgi:hypothetical protein
MLNENKCKFIIKTNFHQHSKLLIIIIIIIIIIFFFFLLICRRMVAIQTTFSALLYNYNIFINFILRSRNLYYIVATIYFI